MGASNAIAVFTYWGALPHRAHRLLTFMALHSLDQGRPGQPARRYWGGREAMAAALGPLAPEPAVGDDSPSAVAARVRRETAFRLVRRALRDLVDAGALREVRRGRVGQRSEYELLLSGLPEEGRDDPPEGGREGPPEQGRDGPGGGSSRSGEGGRSGPPKEYRGTPGTPGEATGLAPSSHQRDSATAGDQDDDDCEHGTPRGLRTVRGELVCAPCRHQERRPSRAVSA